MSNATDAATRQDIAQTILRQLGGQGRLKAMVGANTFTALESGVQFRLKAKADRGINSIRIVLTSDDQYTVEFYAIRALDFTEVVQFEGVYADMLKTVVERTTGLALSL